MEASCYTARPPVTLHRRCSRICVRQKMTVRFAIAAAVSLAISACASRPQVRHELCAPLIDFARSVGPDEERSISFHTSWGRNFRNNPEPAIFAKQCVHGDYRQAKPVCAYLMEHGAPEFAGRNAQRVIACLAPEARFGPDVELDEGVSVSAS